MIQQIKGISDRELLERIYAAQLMIYRELDTTQNNTIGLRKFHQPELFDVSSEERPHAWQHYDEIHKQFDEAYEEFQRQLREASSKGK